MSKGVAKYYLKKFNLRNVKIVSNSDYYDYIMMTNRVYMNFNNNSDTEKLKICYIHNPPAILKYIYSIIRLIVDKRTFKKFTIIKDNKVVTNQDYLLN